MINNNNIDNTDINKDNDNNDENNAQKKIKNITKKVSPCQWSFLIITITIRTNKTHITDKKHLHGKSKNNEKTMKTIKQLLWSPIHKSPYDHSADNVHHNASGYGLGLTVFALSKNYEACFYSC